MGRSASSGPSPSPASSPRLGCRDLGNPILG